MPKQKFLSACLLLILLVMTACGPAPAAVAKRPTAAPPETVQPTAIPTSTATIVPSPTPPPTATATPTPTASPTVTPTATAPPLLPANRLGSVLVLEYHMIRAPEGRWQRAPDNFRADLERLQALGYTPANIIDLVEGFPALPPGRKPVVLTFDDSDISQFRYLADGTLDPDSAVGILYDFHQQQPETWPLKATFYVLQDVDAPERILFGQPAFVDQKLQWLVARGFEVASHTISHFDLAQGSDQQVQWQLAVSQRQLEARLPGYRVRSLSAPFGNYPANEALLAQGSWEGQPYAYASTVEVAGGANPSPHSPEFDPYHIRRVQALQNELDYWLRYFEQNPGAYYVSGQP